MDEDTSGVPLPLFRGRISQDWGAHEARLRAWLRIKGIPVHAREAADVLLLSLEPESHAALVFERTNGVAGAPTFDDGVGFLRAHFNNAPRKKLAQDSAINALELRGFRQRGRRQELVKDLVSDLELLFEKSGVLDDESMRIALIRSFLEFPKVVKRLQRCESYAAAVEEALQWETSQIQKETEIITRARLARRARSPFQEVAVDPTSAVTPAPSTSHHTLGSSRTSISDKPDHGHKGEFQQGDLFTQQHEESTPTDSAFRIISTATPVIGLATKRSPSRVERQVEEPIVERRYGSLSKHYARSPGRGRGRSVSVDLERIRPYVSPSEGLGVRMGGGDIERDESEIEHSRSASTPPFVQEAMEEDEVHIETEPEDGGGVGPGSKRRSARKLTKRSSVSRKAGSGNGGASARASSRAGTTSVLSSSSSTVTGPSISLKAWLSRSLTKRKGELPQRDEPRPVSELAFRPGTAPLEDEEEVEHVLRQVYEHDELELENEDMHEHERERQHEQAQVQELDHDHGSFVSDTMGRPAKVRGGGRATP